MDTLSRHKSFLLASAVLLLASIFTPQTDHPAEDIVPVESHINSEGIVRCFYSSQDLSYLYHTLHYQSKLTISIQLSTTTSTTSHTMDSTTTGQSNADSEATNVDEGTLPRDTKLDPECALNLISVLFSHLKISSVVYSAKSSPGKHRVSKCTKRNIGTPPHHPITTQSPISHFKSLAFLAKPPVSHGHTLIIPKCGYPFIPGKYALNN
jgi:hypothetical protein